MELKGEIPAGIAGSVSMASLQELHVAIEPLMQQIVDEALSRGWDAHQVGAVMFAVGSRLMVKYAGPELTQAMAETISWELRRRSDEKESPS